EEEGDRRRKEEEGDRRRKEEEGDRRRRDDEREEKKRERGRSGSRGENGWERRGRSEEASEEKSLSSERERRDETRASAPSKREQWSNDERSRSRSKARCGGSRGASQSPQRRGTSLSEKRSSDSDPFGIDAVLDLATALHDKYPFEFRVLHVPSLLTALLRPRLQCALRSWKPLASSSSSSSSSSASSCPHAPASAASETGCDSDASSRLPTAVGRLVARFSALAQQEALEVHACYRMLARLEGRADGSSKAFSESASAERDGCTQSWLAPLLAGRMEGRELQRQTQERVTCRLTFDSQTAALRLLRLPLRASAQPYLLSMHALEHVLRVTVLEALRAALVNDWSPDDGEGARLQAEGSAASGKAAGASAGDRGAEPLAAAPSGGDSGVCVVTLVERWLGALPPETARFLIEDVVLQKLLQAVDEWNPVKAKTPIHTWLHPWLPHLSPHHLQLLSSPLRLKIGLALDAKWKATDRSAVNLLLPWATVFDAYSFAALLQRSVMPKLHDHLLNLPIRPDNQHMQPLHDVLVWVPLLPVEMLVNLFLTAFFPRWLQVLKVWINSTHADFSEILEWYSGWKEILPQALVTHARVQGVFVEALQLMNYASATLGLPVIPQPPSTSQAPQPPSPVSAFPHPPSHAAQMGPFPPPGAAPPAPVATTAGAGAAYYLGQGVSGLSSGAQLAPEPVAPGPTTVSGDGTTPAPPGTISSLEYLEGLAKEKGILFKPKVGRIEEGRQVYAYGRMNMYVKDKVIYVKGKAILKWTPVDIDDLLKLAKGEKTSISGSAYSRKGR
ncbi:G-patch domain-containing protein, partial [Toxoplasma gondii MAS]